MGLRRFAVVVPASIALLALAGDAQQVRDPASQIVPTGTGILAGTVVTDETPAKPLRRATVTLSESSSAIVNRLATTDDMGRYAFAGLPPGKYTITASRPPYLRGSYGAHRMTSPSSVVVPTTIPLAPGQRVAGLTIHMQPGAVISGMVRDREGQPVMGASINVWYAQHVSGVRTLVSAGAFTSTDDRGIYRVYGLAPGEYTVAALPAARQTDLLTVNDAEIRRAMDLVQRPGTPNTTPAPVETPTPTVGWAPVFFPGTVDLARAAPVRVAAGEERGGIDIPLLLIATSRVEGTVTGLDGAPVPRVTVQMTHANFDIIAELYSSVSAGATTDSQGRFVMNGVAPGAYTVQAYQAGEARLFGATDVVLQGQNATLALSLQPIPSLTGRVVFEGSSALPNIAAIRVSISRTAARPPFFATTATPQPNGEFTFASVVPDRYRVSATQTGPADAVTWFLKSAIVNGQDVLDRQLDIPPGSSSSIVFTFTDRPTELSGRLSDAANAGVSDFYVIAFAADRAAWTPYTRRIQITRPEHDGRFVFKNLPPGDYRIAFVTDANQGEWLIPEFLAELVDASVKVTLPEGGKVVQDMRVK